MTTIKLDGSRSDEDGPDPLASALSTPVSGLGTPRPDPADKRLPGIKHGYLGQVGVRSSSNVVPVSAHVVSAPDVGDPPSGGYDDDDDDDDDDGGGELPPGRPSTGAGRDRSRRRLGRTGPTSDDHHRLHPDGETGRCTLARSLSPWSSEELDGPPLLPHERLDQQLLARDESVTSTPDPAPASGRAILPGRESVTDPTAGLTSSSSPSSPSSSSSSSSSSFSSTSSTRPSSRTVSHRVSAADTGITPPAGPACSRRGRRRTFALSNPLSGILTTSTVYAADFSNPTIPHHASTAPNTPGARHSLALAGIAPAPSCYFELKKLTEGPLRWSREKNTPPHTPRTSSNEGHPGRIAVVAAAGVDHLRPPTSTLVVPIGSSEPVIVVDPKGANGSIPAAVATVATTMTVHPTTAAVATTDTTTTTTHATSSSSSSVGAPKGKLLVKISQARGLRPSRDPYVVCVCDWNEYISKGAKTSTVDRRHRPSPGRDDDDASMAVAAATGAPRTSNGSAALNIRPVASETGRAVAIPMRSRQSSATSPSEKTEVKHGRTITDPSWDHEAMFYTDDEGGRIISDTDSDVAGEQSDLDISVYDRCGKHETFLGQVRISTRLDERAGTTDRWLKLEPRGTGQELVSGEIRLRMRFQKTDKRQYGPEDFRILKLIGRGTFGQVYQVRKKDTQRIYAMKVLSKKVIVQKKEVAHTVGERNILVRTATTDSPFIVGLKFSFQTPTDLYLVTDFMSGGELFWHLQKDGHFDEHRAKFYIAELILALQHLHQHDIVYRDLKPENILLDANGHIALCDFGLSKANLTKNDTTNTFCGTTEYLAPEVLLDEHGYTKMVDFWSLGVLVFEMCCGWSPFYAEETQQMYKNIAFGKVRFPRDALSTEGRNFVKGLLNRNPRHRLGATDDAEELKRHRFFDDIDWDALMRKDVVPPFKPKLKSMLDTSNFDPEFTNALDGGPSSLNTRAAALASGLMPASTPLSPGIQANFKGFTYVDESAMDEAFLDRHARDDVERMDEDEREAVVDDDDDDDDDDADDDDDGDADDDDHPHHHGGRGTWNDAPVGHDHDDAADDGPATGGNRMSGIVQTTDTETANGTVDHGVFNEATFDI